MNRLLSLRILCACGALTFSGQVWAESCVKVINIQTPPIIDGRLDDACWKDIPAYENFQTLDEGSPAIQSTQIKCVYDKAKMYFAIICRESASVLKNAQTSNAEVRKDDSSIELYFQPNPVTEYLKYVQVRGLWYYIIALNAAGAHYGQCGRFVPLPGEFDVKTTVGADSWQAEIAIPFASLKANAPANSDIWKFQVRRNAFNGDRREGSTLFPALQLANNIDTFGSMAFVENAQQTVTLPTIESTEAETDKIRLQSKEALVQNLKIKKQLIALTPHPAVTDSQKVLPKFIPGLQDIGKAVSIRMARNEYEPASFVLWSPQSYKGITFVTSDLSGKHGKLPAKTLDLRWVKCWYQAGTRVIEMCGYELTPELLLKNAELAQVDLVKQRNILGYIDPPTRASRPDDAKKLQPLKELPAEFAQQVWITAKIPSKAKAGIYRGSIAVMSGKKKLGQIPVEIEVLDFDLRESVLDSCIYVCSFWGPTHRENNPVCAKADMKNLAEHGIRYVGLWEYAQDMDKVVSMMREAGLQTDRMFIGNVGVPVPVGAVGDDPTSVYDKAKVWADVLNKVPGVNETYQYLVDEVAGASLAAEKPIAEALHKAGAKTWVACNSGYFEYGGEFIDVAVVGSWLSRDLAEKVHKAGKRIYSYANPQCGLELPETYRRNYGLLLWQAGYDGGFNFAYNCAFDDPYNDADHAVWKDHLMAYPTKTGVIDTIQWEGWREGVDDCRYLATLEYWIEQVQKSGDAKLASQIQDELTKIKDGGSDALGNLDSVRNNMIRMIRRCRTACGLK